MVSGNSLLVACTREGGGYAPPPPAPIKGGPASISSEYTKEGHFLPREGTYAPHSDLLKRAFSPSGDQMLYFSFTECGA